MATDKQALVSDVATEFIVAELAAEDARKASLESRGLSVISTSGVLVTLLLALAALATDSDTFSLGRSEARLVAVAAAGFVAAALFGLAANWPAPYARVDPGSLVPLLVESAWHEDGAEAKRQLTAARRAQLDHASRRNQKKAWIVIAAMGCEVVAVATMGLAAVTFLLIR